MDNKDFDKIFSDRLWDEQEFDFRESDWTEVSERIQPASKRGPLWWQWLIPIMLLVFCAITYCLVAELKETKKEVLDLNNKLSVYKIEKQDTFNNIITTTVFDTIFKTIVKENQIIKNTHPINSQGNNFSNKNNLKEVEDLQITNIKEKINNDHLNERALIDLLSEIPLKEIELKWDDEDDHFYLNESQFPEKGKGVKNRLKVGLTNAWATTENYSTIDTTLKNNGFAEKIMLDFGLKGEWAFNKHFRGSAAILLTYLQDNFVDKNEDKLGVFDMVFPDVGGELLNGKVTQTTINYQLGLKYLFEVNKKWIPYAGANIEAQSMLLQKTQVSYYYAYQGRNTKSGTFKNQGFNINAVTIFGGYEYQFADQFSWQIEGWHRFNFNQTNDQVYARFGIRNTVLYHF